MLTEVRLYGHLGKRFGRRFKFDVGSPREAVQALQANFKDFNEYLYKNSEPGYYMFADSDNLDMKKLFHPCGRRIIKIIPAIAGAKKSPLLMILIGVALIAVGGPLATALMLPTISTAIVGIGISMALTGVSQLIAGNPRGRPEDSGSSKENTNFSGPVNTVAGGGAVPVVYGKVMAGSVVVSSGISTDISDTEDGLCLQSGVAAKICTIISGI